MPLSVVLRHGKTLRRCKINIKTTGVPQAFATKYGIFEVFVLRASLGGVVR